MSSLPGRLLPSCRTLDTNLQYITMYDTHIHPLNFMPVPLFSSPSLRDCCLLCFLHFSCVPWLCQQRPAKDSIELVFCRRSRSCLLCWTQTLRTVKIVENECHCVSPLTPPPLQHNYHNDLFRPMAQTTIAIDELHRPDHSIGGYEEPQDSFLGT